MRPRYCSALIKLTSQRDVSRICWNKELGVFLRQIKRLRFYDERSETGRR
jgi:hypothetical protein